VIKEFRLGELEAPMEVLEPKLSTPAPLDLPSLQQNERTRPPEKSENKESGPPTPSRRRARK
jgi:hypothetical protein